MRLATYDDDVVVDVVPIELYSIRVPTVIFLFCAFHNYFNSTNNTL